MRLTLKPAFYAAIAAAIIMLSCATKPAYAGDEACIAVAQTAAVAHSLRAEGHDLRAVLKSAQAAMDYTEVDAYDQRTLLRAIESAFVMPINSTPQQVGQDAYDRCMGVSA